MPRYSFVALGKEVDQLHGWWSCASAENVDVFVSTKSTS